MDKKNSGTIQTETKSIVFCFSLLVHSHLLLSVAFFFRFLGNSFDENKSVSCRLEFGAIMSITAAAAFYVASVVWCCMPRRGSKSLDDGQFSTASVQYREDEEQPSY